MSKISFVYFDVGGVALKDLSDTPKWQAILREIGLGKFDQDDVEEIYKSHDDDICTGKMHLDELIPLYEARFGIKVDKQYSLLRATIDNFEQNPSIWPLVKQCQSVCKIGLLTDMWTDMFPELVRRDLLPPVVWDLIIDSTVEGVRKPYSEIYEIAQSRANVPASEILFIDNREKNLVPALALGWQTFFYDSKNYDQANTTLAKFLTSVSHATIK
ncbi:hypothetical protein COT87_02540 [Candidatus Collierbacteria bacterium CG10_big_fil_rev_8_21_14_0_10_44_9]|uniref:HAD family phosphatase n=1 Tax=Candidatus Collierbacteria bacterium CG10_big_fil_rev_8_21_14_0_10_44_9 TaxID=1974535 RepID=A0A2H0VIC6_9BACT|nr:MAG: hypothetical protein COT87_02540 [Candidatus Collierbacteria bacterium CG10_big_fil_rev_8_21_14_0_10_44_9]